MSARRRYQAIVFDVGGTLLNVVRDPQRMAVEAVAHLGTISLASYAAGIRQAVEEWRRDGGTPDMEDLPGTWVSHNRRALAIAGFTGDIAAAARIMEDTFLSDGWELYADVPGTLAALDATGYPLGVVSNWPATLDTTLARVGIRQHFAVVVASGVVGYAKPHPRVFRIAAERLGIAPHRILYVGDSVEYDVVGAGAAGMDAVLLDRSGRHEAHKPRIRTLSQLHDLLESHP
jgi:putative hydrolase of the HAD superfamily